MVHSIYYSWIRLNTVMIIVKIARWSSRLEHFKVDDTIFGLEELKEEVD